jgi:hypothetical protein
LWTLTTESLLILPEEKDIYLRIKSREGDLSVLLDELYRSREDGRNKTIPDIQGPVCQEKERRIVRIR